MDQVLKTGTTTIGLVTADGIILAADKRITIGGGTIMGSIQKIVPVGERMALTIAGSAAEALMISRYLKAEIKLKELRSNSEVTMREAANLLAQFVYTNIRKPSMLPGVTHFLLAGTDKHGQHLYDIFPDGSITQIKDYFCSGSGQTYAYGLIDSNFKENMSVKDAKQLAKKALKSAMKRDAASGNGYDIVSITSKGIEDIESKVFESVLTLD